MDGWGYAIEEKGRRGKKKQAKESGDGKRNYVQFTSLFISELMLLLYRIYDVESDLEPEKTAVAASSTNRGGELKNRKRVAADLCTYLRS